MQLSIRYTNGFVNVNIVVSIYPHVDFEAREKHWSELLTDDNHQEWRETCESHIALVASLLGSQSHLTFDALPLIMAWAHFRERLYEVDE